VRLAALQSVICDLRSGPIGFPAPANGLPVSRGTSRSSAYRRPPLLSQRVHPLLSFASPSECNGPHPPRPVRAKHLPWGLLPLCDISASSPHSRASQARFVPPSGFLTLSTASSSTHLAGLFHPAATSGVLPSGVSSSVAAAPPRRRPLPSCRLTAPPTPLAWGAGCAAPSSGPCSAPESVAST
jgi:hypothetical protein